MKKLLVSLGLGALLLSASPFDKSDVCYKSRVYPVDYNLVFEALKKTFLDSSMHIKNIDKKAGIIEAEGTKTNGDNLYKFTFTANIRNLGDVNKVSTIISYETITQESEVKSVSQFGLPIPVPWSKVFKYKGVTNVIDPDVFDRFYLNVDKSLFDVQMNSMKVEIKKSKDKQLLKDLGEKIDSTKKTKQKKDNNIKQEPKKNQNLKKDKEKVVKKEVKNKEVKKEMKKDTNPKKVENKTIKKTKEVKKVKEAKKDWYESIT